MSFRKILNSMNFLNKKHEEINNRFSTKSKSQQCYSQCLKEDQNEDLRIYGRTNKDTIHKFKERKQMKSQENCVPATKFILDRDVYESDRRTRQFPNKSEYRSKTAVEVKCLKSKKNRNSSDFFLTSETIFHPTCSRSNQNNQQNVKVFLSRKPSQEEKNKQLKRKSIVRYRQSFNRHFQKDVEMAKTILQPKVKAIKPKTAKFQVTTFQKQSSSIYEENNFFNLTQAHSKTGSKSMIKLESDEFIKIFKLLNLNLFSPKFPNKCFRKITIRQSSERWKRILNALSYNVRVFAISTSDLIIYQINSSEKDLTENIRGLLKKQKMFHLCFMMGEQLLYEEFVTMMTWGHNQVQNSIQLLKYLFKRFIHLEEEYLEKRADWVKKIDHIIRYSKSLPKNFKYFLSQIKGKNCIIYSFRQNQEDLKIIDKCISDAMKYLDFQQKETTKDQSLNDWNNKFYFYICSVIFKFSQISKIMIEFSYFSRYLTMRIYLFISLIVKICQIQLDQFLSLFKMRIQVRKIVLQKIHCLIPPLFRKVNPINNFLWVKNYQIKYFTGLSFSRLKLGILKIYLSRKVPYLFKKFYKMPQNHKYFPNYWTKDVQGQKNQILQHDQPSEILIFISVTNFFSYSPMIINNFFKIYETSKQKKQCIICSNKKLCKSYYKSKIDDAQQMCNYNHKFLNNYPIS